MFSGPDEHVEGLRKIANMGSDAVYIHNVNSSKLVFRLTGYPRHYRHRLTKAPHIGRVCHPLSEKPI